MCVEGTNHSRGLLGPVGIGVTCCGGGGDGSGLRWAPVPDEAHRGDPISQPEDGETDSRVGDCGGPIGQARAGAAMRYRPQAPGYPWRAEPNPEDRGRAEARQELPAIGPHLGQ